MHFHWVNLSLSNNTRNMYFRSSIKTTQQHPKWWWVLRLSPTVVGAVTGCPSNQMSRLTRVTPHYPRKWAHPDRNHVPALDTPSRSWRHLPTLHWGDITLQGYIGRSRRWFEVWQKLRCQCWGTRLGETYQAATMDDFSMLLHATWLAFWESKHNQTIPGNPCLELRWKNATAWHFSANQLVGAGFRGGLKEHLEKPWCRPYIRHVFTRQIWGFLYIDVPVNHRWGYQIKDVDQTITRDMPWGKRPSEPGSVWHTIYFHLHNPIDVV